MTNNIEVKGNYVYVNDHSFKFDSEQQAQEFLIKFTKEFIINC
jgi:hypothetical protein